MELKPDTQEVAILKKKWLEAGDLTDELEREHGFEEYFEELRAWRLQATAELTAKYNEMATPTREQVEGLKRNWADDPCWEIETEKGFGMYAMELFLFRKEKEAEWERLEDAKIEAREAETNVCKPLVKDILGFHEIRGMLDRTNPPHDDAIAHALLLLAAQVKRVADVLIHQSYINDLESMKKEVKEDEGGY